MFFLNSYTFVLWAQCQQVCPHTRLTAGSSNLGTSAATPDSHLILRKGWTQTEKIPAAHYVTICSAMWAESNCCHYSWRRVCYISAKVFFLSIRTQYWLRLRIWLKRTKCPKAVVETRCIYTSCFMSDSDTTTKCTTNRPHTNKKEFRKEG